MIVMGRISGAYGVRGMVKLAALSDDPDELTRHPTWWLQTRAGGDWQPRHVIEARRHGGALIATLDGVADREAAAALRGAMVGLERADLPSLRADELYWADLEGLAVVNRDGVALGRVVGLIDNGAHAILRVQGDGGGERLVPWVPAHVDAVDIAAGRIDVDWPADF